MNTFQRQVVGYGNRIAKLGVAAVIGVGLLSSPAHAASDDKAWYDSFWPLGQITGVVRLNKEYVRFKNIGDIPERPALLFEAGDVFLGVGNLYEGFEVPLIGAIWQPRLWAYMINRTALQTFDNATPGRIRDTEIANRMDLFVNLQLTGTEKILLNFRPTDNNEPGRFTKYAFEGADDRFKNEFNLDVESFFFEGDIGSLFPKIDVAGIKPIDYGFTVGRQAIVFQEGILLTDTLDMFGLVRNNLTLKGYSNLRISGLYAWGRVDRNNSTSESDPEMFGLFTAIDGHVSTFNIDMIYVRDDDADGAYLGLSAIQRIKGISTAFRFNGSLSLDNQTVGDGVLLSAEISHTVPKSDDIIYINPYLGIGNFTQAGREAVNGGPLGSLGIMFASPNLSLYGAEINPFTNDVVGFAMGYQAFWDDHKRNMILEFASKIDYDGRGFDSYALGFQLQQKINSYVQLTFESFYVVNTEGRDNSAGGRFEVQIVY
jgi:hypothetical protein